MSMVWRMVFDSVDRNGDGRVDREELRVCLKRLGKSFTAEQVDDALDSYDADQTGDLDYAQFLLLVQGKPAPVDLELLRAFQSMDLDGDGAITVGELDQIFSAAGVNAADAIAEFIAEGDRDQDGRLTFAEFAAIAGR